MRFCLAPMDGVTTCATRLITKEIFENFWSSDDVFSLRTEFMNVDGFLINPEKVVKHLQTTPDQKPIAQIYGGNEKTLIEAAMKIEREYHELFSWIELNTWCPSTTVMKCGGWSDLMKDKKKTLRMIQHLSESLKYLPFSIKARAGVDDADKEAQFAFLVEASRYCSKISVHGRTLKQLYSGEADREFIQQLRSTLYDKVWRCEIIGNGGITSYAQAKEYQKRYKVDGIMIGQSVIWNPWIFTSHIPSLEEKLQTILRHLDLSVACDQLFDGDIYIYPDQLESQIKKNLQHPDFSSHALVEFRKFLFQYVKGMAESREWKPTILMIGEYGQLREAIVEFFSRY